jgi:hypothetical protein
LNTEGFEKEVEELEKKLSLKKISEDEYWDSIQALRQRQEGFDSKELRQDSYNFLSGTVTRAVIIIIPLIVGSILLYFMFLYYPVPDQIEIKVRGTGVIPATSSEKESIYRGLELLREYSTEDYLFVNQYVNTIEVAGSGGFSLFGRVRGFYGPGEDGFGKNIKIVRIFDCPIHCSEGSWNGGDLLTAEFILHEACHSMQYHRNISFSEPQCYEMQFDFVRRVGPSLWSDFREEYFIYEIVHIEF